MTQNAQALPGIGTERVSGFRRILTTLLGLILKPGGVIVSGANSRDALNTGDTNVLRAGVLMGKITTGGKFAPSVIGVSTAAYVDNDDHIHVSLATATECIRRLGGTTGSLTFIGPPSAAGTVAATALTITAITLDGSNSTLTCGDLNLAKVTGSFITMADGSETPLGIMGREGGLRVTDADGADIDVVLDQLIIGGQVEATNIVNYPADASLKAWVKTKLRAVGYAYTFSDDV